MIGLIASAWLPYRTGYVVAAMGFLVATKVYERYKARQVKEDSNVRSKHR